MQLNRSCSAAEFVDGLAVNVEGTPDLQLSGVDGLDSPAVREWKRLVHEFRQARLADRSGDSDTALSLYSKCSQIHRVISGMAADPAGSQIPVDTQAQLDCIVRYANQRKLTLPR